MTSVHPDIYAYYKIENNQIATLKTKIRLFQY